MSRWPGADVLPAVVLPASTAWQTPAPVPGSWVVVQFHTPLESVCHFSYLLILECEAFWWFFSSLLPYLTVLPYLTLVLLNTGCFQSTECRSDFIFWGRELLGCCLAFMCHTSILLPWPLSQTRELLWCPAAGLSSLSSSRLASTAVQPQCSCWLLHLS